MIKLNGASEIVADIIGDKKTPTPSTLRNWTNKGIISGKVEGSTNKAAYPESILIEIIAVIDLKDKYNLTEIGEFRIKNHRDIKKNKLEKYSTKLSMLVYKIEKRKELLAEYNKITELDQYEEDATKDFEKIEDNMGLSYDKPAVKTSNTADTTANKAIELLSSEECRELANQKREEIIKLTKKIEELKEYLEMYKDYYNAFEKAKEKIVKNGYYY